MASGDNSGAFYFWGPLGAVDEEAILSFFGLRIAFLLGSFFMNSHSALHLSGSSPQRGAWRFCIESIHQHKYPIPSTKSNYSKSIVFKISKTKSPPGDYFHFVM